MEIKKRTRKKEKERPCGGMLHDLDRTQKAMKDSGPCGRKAFMASVGSRSVDDFRKNAGEFPQLPELNSMCQYHSREESSRR
ncbi:MAG TPA: hypothetical protein PLM79_12840 [Syntrophobacteraceae bacterium]|nr:hypothetical protein [Syntrophobacteraceae bacterium]